MERPAPYALAVQLAVVLAGFAALAAHLTRPAPPPLPCATPAQILCENHAVCLPGADAVFNALAASAGQDGHGGQEPVRAEPEGRPRCRAVVEPTGRLVTKD